jgi:PcfJ-like protein
MRTILRIPTKDRAPRKERREVFPVPAARDPQPGDDRRELLARVLEDDWDPGEAPVPEYVRQVAHEWQAYRLHVRREAAARLFIHVRQHAPDLLRYSGRRGEEDYIRALFRAAHQEHLWIRSPLGWRPRDPGLAAQFAELVRHLFAVYAVPRFLDAVFHGPGLLGYVPWFYEVGIGRSIRTAPCMTAPLTRKMVHHFLHAPDLCTPVRAIRWGQVMGLDGSERLFRAIANTWMGRELRRPVEEERWLAVLQWLASHPEVSANNVGPLFDYVEAHQQDGGFSLKHQTPASLRRRVQGWHTDLHREQQPDGYCEFQPCGVSGGSWESGEEPDTGVRTLEELLDSKRLWEEGRAMRHCVASYVPAVLARRSAIWSLKIARAGVTRRALTIELDVRTSTIVQARGPQNRSPQAEERRILALWARENDLTLAA